MRVLIACEESQTVCIAFREKGHDAFKLSKEERAKVRSKTFPGIAKAMADNWG
jgi:hypothetical protein